MRVRRYGAALVVLAATSVFAGVLAACGGSAESERAPSCAQAVLRDWSDGKLRSGYPADCYLAALDAMPEDLRAYSSAANDIARFWRTSAGLQAAGGRASTGSRQRVASPSRSLEEAPAPRVEPDASAALKRPSSQLLALAGVVVAVVLGGLAASVARRLRERA